MTKLAIPDAALEQHVIALGKTGSGKSSKLRLIVERQLDQRVPVTIIDPKGDWWGLKSSADGKSAGYPIVIFGGEHADVPLNPLAGAHVAELIATGNRPSLIDLGGWMVGERTRFFIDFASMFFKLTRGPRKLVIDEVHNFAPQGKIIDVDAGKMLHWANRLASEGRGKGLTLIAASQRPQKVHKDFVTSCETLIACRVIHKLDRDAIKDWIDGCADPALGKQVLSELANMKRDEAWVWSPEIDFGPERISFPLFKTYDSFKAQAADAGKLKGWAEVDLEDVKTKLASVVREAQANDPRELKKLVADLQRQLKAKPGAHSAPPAPTKEQLQAAEARGYERGYRDRSKVTGNEFASLEKGLISFVRTAFADLAKSSPPPKSNGVEMPARKAMPTQFPVRPPPTAKEVSRDLPGLSAPARKILTVLAQHPDGCTAKQLALLTVYRYSGGFRNSLSELRTAGLMAGENTGVMRITDAGLQCGPFAELPQGEELRAYWLQHSSFGKCSKDILAQLLEHPDGLSAEELAKRTNYEYSGGFRNSLSDLRTAGVLVGKNTETMRASEELLS